MKKKTISFFAVIMFLNLVSTEYTFAATGEKGSLVEKQEQTTSSEDKGREGTEDTEKWIEKETNEKDYEDFTFTESHYVYGIYIGEQSSGMTSVIRKDGKVESVDGKKENQKLDKKAIKFVEQVVRYQHFNELADRTINPLEFVFAKVRAGQAKHKAMKLIKDKYRTPEVKEALGFLH